MSHIKSFLDILDAIRGNTGQWHRNKQKTKGLRENPVLWKQPKKKRIHDKLPKFCECTVNGKSLDYFCHQSNFKAGLVRWQANPSWCHMLQLSFYSCSTSNSKPHRPFRNYMSITKRHTWKQGGDWKVWENNLWLISFRKSFDIVWL